MSDDLVYTISLDEFKHLASDLDTKMQTADHSYQSKIVVRWIIRGMEGGNCWGGEPSSMSPEEEPEDEFLCELLEQVAPSISYLKFRRIEKPGLYGFSEKTVYEYYGNYTEYRYRELNLDELYSRLLDD